MKTPDTTIFVGAALAAALGVAACGGPVVETSKSALPTPASTGTPANTENPYRLVPVPCKTKMPWEGGFVKPVVIFTSMKKPANTSRPGIGPECWEIVPNATAKPSQSSQ